MKIVIDDITITMGRLPHDVMVMAGDAPVGPVTRFNIAAKYDQKNVQREICFAGDGVGASLRYGLFERFARAGFDVFVKANGVERLVCAGRKEIEDVHSHA